MASSPSTSTSPRCAKQPLTLALTEEEVDEPQTWAVAQVQNALAGGLAARALTRARDMNTSAATPLDRSIVRIGLRLLGNPDAASLVETAFRTPPFAALIGSRWTAIFYCWCATAPCTGLGWLGFWAALHAIGGVGQGALLTGFAFLMSASIAGALDACWRAILARPISKRIRQRDITQTELPLRLRIAEWNNQRLVLQLVVGVCAATLVTTVWH